MANGLVPDIGAQLGRGIGALGQLQQQQILREEQAAAQQAAQAQLGQQQRLAGLQQQVLGGQQPVRPLNGQGARLPVEQQQAQGLAAQREIEQAFPEQALATQKARQARFETLGAEDKQRVSSVVKGALEVQGLPPEQMLTRLTARRNALADNGIDTTDTDEVIGLLQSGDTAGANTLIQQSVQAGQGLGILEDTAAKQAELDIKRQNTQLRELERQQRILDRQVANETNRLRQQELQQKLDAKDREVNHARLNRQFEADNAVGNIDNSIATVDRLLSGAGLESAAGISAAFPTIPGTEAASFEAELEVLQSQAFLAQVEKMKGLGALSENEGKKLGSAIGALSLDQSDESLRASLGRIKEQFEKAKAKINTKFGRTEVQPTGAAALTAADLPGLSDQQLEALLQGAQ